MHTIWTSVLLLGLSMPAWAQDEDAAPEAAPMDEAADEAPAKPDDAKKKRDPLLDALELPAAAKAARDAGVKEGEVKKALKAMRGKGVSAAMGADVMRKEAKSTEEHGPVDDFGAFVRKQLELGKRGRDLSAAVRAEHKARGAKHKAPGEGRPQEAKGEGKAKQPDRDRLDRAREMMDKGKGGDGKGKPGEGKPGEGRGKGGEGQGKGARGAGPGEPGAKGQRGDAGTRPPKDGAARPPQKGE